MSESGSDKPVVQIVDDKSENLKIMMKILMEQGCEVRTSINGPLALKSIHTDPHPPDLILLDIMMPGMNGFEVCEKLKADERTRDIPVIFISALHDAVDKVRAFSAGGVDYITKPFQEDEVLARVKTHLAIRNMQKSLQKTNARLEIEIAERKQAENALLKEKEFTDVTLDTQSDTFFVFEPATGKAIRWNKAFRDISGYTDEEISSLQAPDSYYSSEDLKRAATFTESAFRKGGGTIELALICKDSRRIPTEYVVSILNDEKGDPKYFISIGRDITERKQAEEELEKVKQAALEAQHAAESANQAKSAFLANMSHELRTPLNAIIGFSRMLDGNPVIPPKSKEHLAIIRRSGEHLLALINDVLDISKIEAGHTVLNEQNIDVYRLLDDMKAMFHLRAENKELHLTFECDAGVPRYIRTDEIKLREVLVNLLNNALKFTLEGSILVRVGAPLVGDPNEIGQASEIGQPQGIAPTCLRFEISDTGPGIAPDDVDRVFDAFVQSDSGRQSLEGTGLGLSISRKFVRMMGGDITVESEVGGGSAFSFWIQAEVVEDADIEPALSEKRVIGLEPNQPRYRILIADDIETNRLQLLNMLKLPGFELRGAAHGKEALDIWREWKPHLIFMDMRMPVMDGYTATREIRNSKPVLSEAEGFEIQNIPIVAVTASVFKEERGDVLAAGFDDVVRKPVTDSQIFDVLTKHLGVRFVYETPPPTEVKEIPVQERDARTVAAMDALPVDMVSGLEQALLNIDLERAAAIIERIRALDACLADTLQRYIDDFEYERIVRLIQDAASQKGRC